MTASLTCPRCGNRKAWVLGDGRRRCARCRLDWRPGRLPLRLSLREWRAIATWFARGDSAEAIARQTGINRKRVLRALETIRRAMAADLGDAELHDPLPVAESAELMQGRGRKLTPVIGIRWTHVGPLAEVVPDLDAAALGRAVRRTGPLRHALPEALGRYEAMGARGRLHRLPHADGPPSHSVGELGAFWAFLRRHLGARGGVRHARLGLFLAEYSWRYQHRKLLPREQARRILALIGRRYGGATGTLRPSGRARRTPGAASAAE